VGIKGGEVRDGDFVEHMFVSSSHDDLLCFTDTGRVFRLKVWQVPELGRTSKGRSLNNLLDLREGERVRAFLPIKDFEASEDYLFFATAQGRVKRSALKDYRNVNRSGIIAVKLNDGDGLVNALLTRGNDHVLLSTAQGMAIRFDENDARVMGRDTAGVAGIDLAEGDSVVGLVRCDDTADLCTVTLNGYGKRTPMREYLVQQEDGSTRVQSRGGKGRKDIVVNDRNGPVVSVHPVTDDHNLLFMTTNGMAVRIAAKDVRAIGRNTQGVRVVRLRDGDTLRAAARVDASEDGPAPTEAVPADDE
jgi:DNA gyrase subunit A